MSEFFNYIFIASACLSMCYLAFLLFKIKEHRFTHQRYFLLLSMIISIIIPFSEYGIQLNIQREQIQAVETIEPAGLNDQKMTPILNAKTAKVSEAKTWTVRKILILVYFAGMFVMAARLLLHLLLVLFYCIHAKKEYINDIPVWVTNKISSPFTFFNRIFLPKEATYENENLKIIIHEKIHSSQYHSFDLLLIEALSAVMWFNPFIWMMRKSVQLVHEYLADEGVLNTGFDRLRYQALLLNQATEERLICLSSGFNHSIIKKRMIMMTKSKFNQKPKLRILALLPLSAILFFGIACVNGQSNKKEAKALVAVAPLKMNVLYLGVENPVNIAVSGYESSEISVSVDNGRINGKNGEYFISPDHPGSAVLTVSSNGEEIQQTTFRVKVVPNPKAVVAVDYQNMTNGTITKKQLLDAGEIKVIMENFDFDLNFEIVSYVMSATVPGKFIIREEITEGGSYSPLQKDLIESLIPDQKLMIEEIYAVAPDGSKRKLNPMVFRITE